MEPLPEQSDYTALNSRYRGALLAFFLRRTGNYSDAEDLVQEVFVRLLASDHGGGPRGGYSFIFEIAANLLRDRHRRATVRASFRTVTEPLDSAKHDPLTPERVLISKREVERALAALDEVGVQSRRIFTMFRFEQVPQKEIARQLGISLSAVEKHVALVLVHLNKRLKS